MYWYQYEPSFFTVTCIGAIFIDHLCDLNLRTRSFSFAKLSLKFRELNRSPPFFSSSFCLCAAVKAVDIGIPNTITLRLLLSCFLFNTNYIQDFCMILVFLHFLCSEFATFSCNVIIKLRSYSVFTFYSSN